MRNILCMSLGALFVGSASFACSQQSQSQALLESEAEQKVKVFATQLKSALQTAIQTDGLHKAVKVCEEQAPLIATSLSTDGWTVARTSLKTRNDTNQPNEWETQILEAFNDQQKLGADSSTLSSSELDGSQFRYMKAIPTGQVCLACHGSSVDPALQATITALYPNDIALGYSLGEVRGAFTLSKSLN